MKKILYTLLGVVFPLSGLFSYDVIPRCVKSPDMAGKFNVQEWDKALKLDKFLVLRSKKPSPVKTEVFLQHDGKVLYLAAVLHGEDVPALLKNMEKDKHLFPWRLTGIEMFFGGKVYLQMAFDYMGRLYCNYDHPFYTKVNHHKNRYVIRTAIPFAQLPRAEISPELLRVNFYRKHKNGVSSAYFNRKSSFLNMEETGLLLLETPETVIRKLAGNYEKELDALLKNQVISPETATGIKRMIADKTAHAIAESKKGNEAFLAAFSVLHSIRKDIADGRKEYMEKKYGAIRNRRAILPKYFCSIPEKWIPKKMCGRDFWYGYITVGIDSLEKAGLLKEPLLRDALLFFRWDRPDEFLPGGKHYKWAAKFPNNPIAIKTIDRSKIPKEERGRREYKALYDKEFIRKFLAAYGERFQGFFEDEAFANDTGVFSKRLQIFNIPKPKNREQALAAFEKLYKTTSPDVPSYTAFRNLANMSPETAKYVSNGAAIQLNHLVLALGDRMSGNENGDCMGAFAPKVAFARGASRQYGKPWRNYNTYYSGTFLNCERGMGRCVGKTTYPGYAYAEYQLSERCLKANYCHLDGLRAGTPLEAQKQSYLYPFMCGAGIWVSEADIEEITSVYEMGDKVENLVRNLRDQKLYLSPIARQQSHFYTDIVRKRDRGVSATPVALVFDRAHGYLPLYFGGRVWDMFTPTELERTMWAIDHHLYRREENVTTSAWSVNPFGDIFDVITNDVKGDFLQDYPVVYPVGDVTLDRKFSSQLEEYVKNGGTLVINTALLAKYPHAFGKDFLGCTLSGKTGSSPATYSKIGPAVITEKNDYQYRIIVPAGGSQILACTMDSIQAPAILCNPYGKGRVIVTTPENMKVKDSCEEMLAIFDHLMGVIRNEALPLKVETTLQYSVNRNKNGWAVYLHNTKGLPARKPVFYGKAYPGIDRTRTGKARITIPEQAGKVKKVIDWWTGKEIPFNTGKSSGQGDCTVEVTLPGCDTTVIEFVME